MRLLVSLSMEASIESIGNNQQIAWRPVMYSTQIKHSLGVLSDSLGVGPCLIYLGSNITLV